MFSMNKKIYYIFPFAQVPDTEDDSGSSDFKEFTNLLLSGQKIANDTGKSHFFVWKGYKACISSQLPKLSTHEITRRFNLAMESIKKSDNEEQLFRPSRNVENIDNDVKKAAISVSSSASGQSSSYSSSRTSTDSLISDDLTQIPETQFVMEGKFS